MTTFIMDPLGNIWPAKDCEHLELEDLVPVCPTCKVPLDRAEADPTSGVCPNRNRLKSHSPALLVPSTWDWMPKAYMDSRDYAPRNERLPIDLTGLEERL